MKASVASERYQEELNVRFVVAENNRVVKPKCYQVTLRYLKVKQFSSSFNWNNTFNALLTNGGIGKGIGYTGKGIKKNDIHVM